MLVLSHVIIELETNSQSFLCVQREAWHSKSLGLARALGAL